MRTCVNRISTLEKLNLLISKEVPSSCRKKLCISYNYTQYYINCVLALVFLSFPCTLLRVSNCLWRGRRVQCEPHVQGS